MFNRPKPPKPGGDRDQRFQTPAVVFQPQTARGMLTGVDLIANLLRPTLGPLPHTVANEKARGSTPELLDDGGTIARRIIQIHGRDADVGAMFLRHMLWKLHQTEGDGTATAAVIFQTIYKQGLRYVAAGGNAMVLRRHFEAGMIQILAALDAMVQPVSGRTKLTGLARTICYDDELARILGEIFDIIGAYGRLEVRKGAGTDLEREYVEGIYWDTGLVSRQMIGDGGQTRCNFENPSVLITDIDIQEPEQLAPVLNLAIRAGIKQLLVVAPLASDKVIGMLVTKANREKIQVAIVKAPGMSTTARMDALEDLAFLTGGRPVLKAAGDRLDKVRLEHLGRARRTWADLRDFGINGGRGNPRVLRQHIATLRQTYRSATSVEDRRRLLERLGKLMGGAATLYVGGISTGAVDARVELATRTAEAMRGAIREGVVPGGGSALLACRAALLANAEPRGCPDDAERRAAYTILARAMEEPARALLANAGCETGAVLGHIFTEIEQGGPGYGYDVAGGQVAQMSAAGIVDSASVVKSAVHSAISSAALLLTTDVIIHLKNPPEQINT